MPAPLDPSNDDPDASSASSGPPPGRASRGGGPASPTGELVTAAHPSAEACDAVVVDTETTRATARTTRGVTPDRQGTPKPTRVGPTCAEEVAASAPRRKRCDEALDDTRRGEDARREDTRREDARREDARREDARRDVDPAQASADAGASGRRGPTFGPYVVLREVGRGASAVVYAARREGLDRVVALKVLRDVPDEAERARFELESRLTARLRHPAIVRVHDVGEAEDGRPWIATDLHEAGSLADLVRARGPLAADAAATIAARLADGLAAAHAAGVLHRDVKPGNVLVGADGEPVLADFGMARDLRRGVTGPTAHGEVLGTPAFMAPEQARGEPVDGRADVWGLGATLFCLLSGLPPVEGDTPLAVLEALAARGPRSLRACAPRPVGRSLEAIVARCLAEAPAARYPSAAELALDLRRHLAGEPVVARVPGPLDRAAAWLRRRRRGARALAQAAFAAGVLLAAATGLFALRLGLAQREADAAAQAAGEQRVRAEAVAALARGTLDALTDEVSERLEDLPGEAPRAARRRLLGQALAGLERLRALDDATDPLSATTARAHVAMGELALEADAGGTARALGEFERAVQAAELACRGSAVTLSVRAHSLRRRGEMRRAHGDARGSQRDIDEALNLATCALAHASTSVTAQGGLASVLLVRGSSLRAHGDIRGALATHEAALAIATHVARRARSPEASRALTAAFGQLCADLEAVADLERARSCALEALAVHRRLAAEAGVVGAAPVDSTSPAAWSYAAPTSRSAADVHRDLATCLTIAARVEHARNEPQAKLAALCESAALWRACLRRDPDGLHAREGLAAVLVSLADALQEAGRLEDGWRAALEARALLEALIAQDPRNAGLRLRLVTALAETGDLLEGRGDIAGASAAQEAAAEQARSAIALAPQDLDAAQRLALALGKATDLYVQRANLVAARAAAEESLAIREQLVLRQAGSVLARHDVVSARVRVAEVRERTGDLVGALAYVDSGIAACRALLAEHGLPAAERSLTLLVEKAVDLHTARRDVDAARAAADELLSARRRAVARDPGAVKTRRDLMVALDKVADVTALEGRTGPGLLAMEEAVGLARALRQEQPGDAGTRRDLGLVLGKLAYHHTLVVSDGGDERRVRLHLELAREAAAEAIAVREQVVADDASHALAREELASALELAGQLALQESETALAVLPLSRAVELRRDVLRLAPDDAKVRRNLTSTLDLLGSARSDLGDHQGAIAAHEEAIALCRELLAPNPRLVGARRDLCLSLARSAMSRGQAGDLPIALAHIAEAITLFRPIAARVPRFSGELEWLLSIESDIRAAAERMRGDAPSPPDVDPPRE